MTHWSWLRVVRKGGFLAIGLLVYLQDVSDDALEQAASGALTSPSSRHPTAWVGCCHTGGGFCTTVLAPAALVTYILGV